MGEMLRGLQPELVFRYFEEISRIPRGSGNRKPISDYCVSFAEEHSLEVTQDEAYNVIIKKPASKGYESHPTVMLQGHLDMVEERESGSNHDFSRGLEIGVDGDWIYAKETTLGGDDGIAVAYMLAILADNTRKHPALECVFTADEEIGLLGASDLDLSGCKASYLINLDSEAEGVFLASCAGGVRANLTLPLERISMSGSCFELVIDGLQGGHSGTEIHKERANANVLMGRLLLALSSQTDLEWGLLHLEGGQKDNAIPRSCRAVIVSEEPEEEMKQALAQIFEKYQKEYAIADPDLGLVLKRTDAEEEDVLHPSSLMKLLFFLTQCRNGVQHMSQAVPGLVETSLNLGILKMEEEEARFSFSLRSSVESRKQEMLDRLAFLIEFLGGEIGASGDYPGWEYKVDSTLRERMTQIWEEMYHKTPVIDLIHAGVECGLIQEKMPGLDIVSIGPDMKDIHTPRERLSISSAKRVYEFLIRVLESL